MGEGRRSMYLNCLGIWICIVVLATEIGSALPLYKNKNNILQHNYKTANKVEIGEHLSRHKRSSNGTVDTRSDIEKFYADPNNKAMYLVLPLMVLVYGGCSSIYCIHKCRKYFKNRREKQQLERLKKSMTDVQHPECSTAGNNTPMDLTNDRTSPGVVERTGSNDTLLPNTIEEDPMEIKEEVLYPKIIEKEADINRNTVEALPMEDIEGKEEIKEPERVVESSFITTPRVNSGRKSPMSPAVPTPTRKVKVITPVESDKSRPTSNNDANEEDPIQTPSLADKALAKRPESKLSTTTTSSSLPDVAQKKLPKVTRFSDLSDSDIKTILNYYSEKKHMPDVIPEEEENQIPLRRAKKKLKYRVFNG